MTVDDVIALIEQRSDPRGIAHWQKRYPDSALRSVGVGLTQLRKLAKEIGRDHALARQLWQSDVYEARVMGLLVDEPAAITRDQAEEQVEALGEGQLAHVFSSCDAALAKAPFAQELADDWVKSDDPMRRRCGYGLVYELSKSKKKTAPSDEDFEAWLARIDATRGDADVDELMAMGTALMGVGKRSARLWAEALRLARAISPIDWDPTGACEPFDVVKHLDNDRLRAKLGV
ncbi:MAG: DNA alkylation repair protein [Myxococcales bacterium]|nr:DNA alkylation repair protein [Myxococcales bacterium]